MPMAQIALLQRFLAQNDGYASQRARTREFAAFTDEESCRIERIFAETFGATDARTVVSGLNDQLPFWTWIWPVRFEEARRAMRRQRFALALMKLRSVAMNRLSIGPTNWGGVNA